MIIKNKKKRSYGYITEKTFEQVMKPHYLNEYGRSKYLVPNDFDSVINCKLKIDNQTYRDNIHNDEISFNDINRDKFYWCCEQGKLKVIHMLKSDDPEIREIAECLSVFMTTKETI
jgi:hypothetical protein